MAELDSWDITAANNNSAPPNGWPESTMQYSEVNNTAREGMAVVARYFQDINGTLQIAGPVNAYTLTLNAGYLAYFQGMYFAAEVNITNTAAATINVNALGIKTITDQAGNALGAGDLKAGGVYEFRYDGTVFQLLGSSGSGSIIAEAIQVRADINTATPPTTEAVVGAYDLYDADGTDLIGQVGFSGSNTMRVSNKMHAGPIVLAAEDTGGVERSLFSGDPNGAASLFRAGIVTGRTLSVAGGGFEVDQSVTAAGFERVMTVSDNALKANLVSPTFTGNPLAPTPALNDNDTSIATTAYVVAQIADDAPTKTGGGASGNWAIDITGHADFVAVADESVDTACNVAFFTQATGNLAARTGTNLTFNSASGLLTATSLAGAGSGITALNMNNASSGTLAVARGGTGVTSSTGTGSTVRSASPNFTGQPDVSGLAIPFWATSGQTSGDITISTAAASGGANGDIHFRY